MCPAGRFYLYFKSGAQKVASQIKSLLTDTIVKLHEAGEDLYRIWNGQPSVMTERMKEQVGGKPVVASKWVVMFSSAMTTESITEKWVHRKKKCNPLRLILNLSTWSSSPGVRGPISVAILLNPLRKNRAVMQMLVLLRQRWTRWWEGQTYPAFKIVVWRESRSWCVAGKKKSGEEAKKKQQRRIDGKRHTFITRSGIWNSWVLPFKSLSKILNNRAFQTCP
jgi:hypothetical protein